MHVCLVGRDLVDLADLVHQVTGMERQRAGGVGVPHAIEQHHEIGRHHPGVDLGEELAEALVVDVPHVEATAPARHADRQRERQRTIVVDAGRGRRPDALVLQIEVDEATGVTKIARLSQMWKPGTASSSANATGARRRRPRNATTRSYNQANLSRRTGLRRAAFAWYAGSSSR